MNRYLLGPGNRRNVSRQVHPALSKAELPITYAAIGITLPACAAFCAEGAVRLIERWRAADWISLAELMAGRALGAFLLFGAIIYQLLRVGCLRRFAAHRPAPAAELERIHDDPHPPRLTVLVPSYKEERRVVRQTLMAAALQQFPNRRVVLLIDDPPAPTHPEDATRLDEMRALPSQIARFLAEPAHRFNQALAEFNSRCDSVSLDPARELETLASLLGEAADWLEGWAARTPLEDHTDRLFVERILRAPAREHRARAAALIGRNGAGEVNLLREYRRLAALFQVEITTFERKGYVNLSHEPNKAMNLNSYLGLMGKAFREVKSGAGNLLLPCVPEEASLTVPPADFVVVLDADSLILSDYSLRLIHFMRQPGNERVAVAQTPYTSIPGAPNEIERMAGATTDVQLMSHQGAVLFGAGSWVGASALVRPEALEDIAFTQEERGHRVWTYIRDRTLNEDTDTTVDLIRKGWTVYNYPARLAYSATPPDFGSLLIQRRRWATGGLIILPNVVRYVLARPSFRRLAEALIRCQYILSAPLGSIAIMALLVYPFESTALWSYWPLPAFLAYMIILGRDLLHNGGRAADVFRALALNAMLLPINLAGAVNSLQQICTGRKFPFRRTPKVQGRTAASPLHVLAQLGLLALASSQLVARIGSGSWVASAFFALYAAGSAYALQAFIGWRAAFEDLLRPVRTAPALARENSAEASAPSEIGSGGGWAHRAARSSGTGSSLPLAVFGALLLLGQMGWAAPPPSGRQPSAPRQVAVTFDDLPFISVTELDAATKRDLTRKLLVAITSRKIPALGFVNEYELYWFAKENNGPPDENSIQLLKMWLDAGLELGNHTFAHVDLHRMSLEAFERDVVRGEPMTRQLMEQKGLRLRYFRHPYLHTGLDLTVKRELERFLAERQYRIAPVTLDNEDWVFAAAYSRAAQRGDQRMMRRIGAEYVNYTRRVFEHAEAWSRKLFGREIRQILLVHGNALNADYFGEIARMINSRGYSFISLDEALRDEAYASEDTYTGGGSIDWLARWAVTRGLKTNQNALDDFPDVPKAITAAAQ
jgi:cellulose synthase/poly-beta-1,6-N-acetylglucosamine synthase-like glycosyltransferase/peptidoglycan/xylan/chitin deacetylase (PgdA/CDA1 family)